MHVTLEEIARLIGAKVAGESGLIITGLAGIKEAKEGDITFLANLKYAALVNLTQASAVIVPENFEAPGKILLKVGNPSLAFSKIAQAFAGANIKHPYGIHPAAVVAKNSRLAENVSVGACAVVEEGAVIGKGTIIYPNVFIGSSVKIGDNCLIYSNVSVRENVEIGDRVIIHCGTVVGSDGFGFVTVDGKHEKVPQTGTVVVGDDVEIGACVTIDRARFGKTMIGAGTKVDNLVQIAHNVIIGKNCIIVAQVGIAGSTVLGDNVTLAGQVGVAGHLKIGNNVIVAAQSGVSKSIPDNSAVFGSPAKPFDQAKRLNACVGRLPVLYKRIEALEEKIKELEIKANNG